LIFEARVVGSAYLPSDNVGVVLETVGSKDVRVNDVAEERGARVGVRNSFVAKISRFGGEFE
jgi:hypothetical protein